MVEITALSTSGTIILDTLVDPGVPIPVRASAVHGIRDQDVAGALALSDDLLPRLSGILRAASRIVAYNAPFYPRTRVASQVSHGEARRRPAAHAGMRAA